MEEVRDGRGSARGSDGPAQEAVERGHSPFQQGFDLLHDIELKVSELSGSSDQGFRFRC